MQKFNYSARDVAGNKIVKSVVEAESERSAAKLLMEQGMVPLTITPAEAEGGLLTSLKNHVSTRDRVIFTRQLATLINAGLPLAQSLHTVAEQTANQRLQTIARDIITRVEGGSTLSDAFAKHGDVFSDLFVALIAAGEASGTLDKALERIASQQEKDAEILSKVRGAMVYPAIVLVVILGVIIFMMLTVVPQIQRLYKDLRATLPFITASMVYIANFMTKYWWLILIALGVSVYFLRQYVKTDAGRHNLDRLKMNLPMFGVMFRKLYMARFARTGETLLATGVPMLEMLKISARSVGNSLVAKSIERAAEKVKSGKALSVALKNDANILPLVPQMISIGEQSGGIDTMMGKAASFYEGDLDNTIRSISTAIEPILMVVLAAVAGLMVAAILLPVYGLIGSGALR
ncbi:MAG: type II secretion system F family protein [Candidatus Chaera renei]|uniref:Type II secretion system F family protein n=1 Tax=Candidatus Chaera renei TaxID=2506947 RepID=A0A4Q0AJL4_9BACT|nr:MAG: type II secretion system F family protein [Candidatus Chaera renei]